ncbi:MAG: cobalamin B12-binding domain-containing protein [Chloroflexi bacterium]|nr:cobalamin B12-binding domain-containing protein [Chloroflexota bacterium]
MSNLEKVQAEFLDILLAGDTNKAVAITKETLESGTAPTEFFESCIAPSLAEIGKQFETLDIFLPEMVTAAEIVQKVNDEVITPAVEVSQSEGIVSAGKVLMATVQGDLHDIGKNMVVLMLKVNGFEVVDLGTNVSPSDIVSRAEQDQVDIIGMSSLLTTCLPYMKDVYDHLDSKNTRNNYKVIMGGAATTPDFSDQVGADGYGHSAAEAVALCQKLMK